MILFVSDLHFGRADAAQERAKEADLIACLRAYEAEVEHLYLLGDVFDQYIEYPTLIPKGFVRFQALLAAWTDRRVPVTYLVGNHDPWHRDYFERELGVRVIFDALEVHHYDQAVYLTHGDGVAPGSRLYRWLKPVIRHPIPVGLYRSLLPGDSGFRLARWVSTKFGGKPGDEATIEGLRRHAQRLLAETPATLVIMGHSHRAEHRQWPEGHYVNLGSWDEARTFGCLDANTLRLLRWNEKGTLEVDTL